MTAACPCQVSFRTHGGSSFPLSPTPPALGPIGWTAKAENAFDFSFSTKRAANSSWGLRLTSLKTAYEVISPLPVLSRRYHGQPWTCTQESCSTCLSPSHGWIVFLWVIWDTKGADKRDPVGLVCMCHRLYLSFLSMQHTLGGLKELSSPMHDLYELSV